jgi:hypothetical protein
MSEKNLSIKKAIPIVVVTWIFSLVTTLTIVYFASFVPIGTNQIGDSAVTPSKIADSAIIVTKLADDSTTSAKILDGTITAADLADNSVTAIKIVDGAVTTTKVADYAITNLKLAANSIPFNFTNAHNGLNKITATWENITDIEVKLTLQRNSTLLIMFSTEASISTSTERVQWQARVNEYLADPGTVWLQPSTTGYTSSISYNFYRKGLTAGQYTIYMQWSVTGGATAHLEYRSLTVIALPE